MESNIHVGQHDNPTLLGIFQFIAAFLIDVEIALNTTSIKRERTWVHIKI
jgi:hypothetical protein